MNIDNRRSIQTLMTEDIKQVNSVFAKHGAVMGKHFHKETDEIFYMISGLIFLKVDDWEGMIHPHQAVKVPMGKLHTVISLAESHYLVFLSKPFDEKDPDIHGKEDGTLADNPSQGQELPKAS